MSKLNHFQNRVLETRDPKNLIVITKTWMKNNAELADKVEQFYDLRAERPLDPAFKSQVEETGYIHTPLFITAVEGVGDIVVEGRQRKAAALALGYSEVPVIEHDPETDLSIELELTSNLARSENTILENAVVFKKALQKGISMDRLAKLAGISSVHVLNTMMLGEMPKFVHKWIEEGLISATAALQFKAFGKKAPKAAGVSKVYDDEAQKAIKDAFDKLDLEAKMKGSGKVKVKQARQSASKSAEGLSRKEWEALVSDSETPEDYAALIQVFLNKLNPEQAVKLHPENLSWLRRVEPPKKERKVKEPKTAKAKAPKDVDPTTTDSDEDMMRQMFQ